MAECKLFSILQICDTAFPTGGFAHSMGTEAALANGYLDTAGLKSFILCCLENTGSSCIPFIKASHEAVGDLRKLSYLDWLYNVYLLNHVSYRASKQQGRSFLTSSCSVFHLPEIEKLKNFSDDQNIHCHLPIVFGAVCATLKIPALKVGQMFLFNSLRTIIASIVRLGRIGTIQAQRLQFEIQENCLDDVLSRNWSVLPTDVAFWCPMTEVIQNSHDAAFSRLFFS